MDSWCGNFQLGEQYSRGSRMNVRKFYPSRRGGHANTQSEKSFIHFNRRAARGSTNY